ncbi:DNA polymerase Y family protein [Limibacillus sp. MBR-115]|uniref:Y-family DNA polymerase n=1 Tax=Limibacillus sp. MBR-115 TaxID=3156465 RepID=UPI0033980647
MKRVLSLWLPRFATERYHLSPARNWEGQHRLPEAPFALTENERGLLRLSAVDRRAEAQGLTPGLPLTQARALLPGLVTLAHDRGAEKRRLEKLADWLERYSPWVALDESNEGAAGSAACWLDISGCAHLFGGEAMMGRDLLHRLEGWGLTVRLGLADTPGAAWAVARFATAAGEPLRIVPADGQRAALASLPIAALRLQEAEVELLGRFGLLQIGQLYELPPAGLAPRLGGAVQRRLRQALGAMAEPLSPRRAPLRFEARLGFSEPVAAVDDLAAAVEKLLQELCRTLQQADQGARRLLLVLHRVDASRQEIQIGVSKANRDPEHLGRLLADRQESFDPGYGVEVMTLAAGVTEPLSAEQMTLADRRKADRGETGGLLDRLLNRLGTGRVYSLEQRPSHWPEAAQVKREPTEKGDLPNAWRSTFDGQNPAGLRPLRLLPRPEPIETLALLPDHPPVRFVWRRVTHLVARAEGPERLLGAWWERPLTNENAARDAARGAGEPARLPQRDYYRVEDQEGRRFWLFRDGGDWFLHGLFG